MGGRLAFLTRPFGKQLAGVIGFYGWPVGAHRTNTPAPADLAGSFECPVLAVVRGCRRGDPRERVTTFEAALDVARVPHEVTTYPKAPHGFFDKKADEFAVTSAKAWDQVLGFIRSGVAA